MQTDDAMLDEKVPAEHFSHSVAPASLNVPAKHTEQIVDPVLLEKYPGLHGVQVDDALFDEKFLLNILRILWRQLH